MLIRSSRLRRGFSTFTIQLIAHKDHTNTIHTAHQFVRKLIEHKVLRSSCRFIKSSDASVPSPHRAKHANTTMVPQPDSFRVIYAQHKIEQHEYLLRLCDRNGPIRSVYLLCISAGMLGADTVTSYRDAQRLHNAEISLWSLANRSTSAHSKQSCADTMSGLSSRAWTTYSMMMTMCC